MEDVLITNFAIMMLAIFCSMFGYALRVIQEERALARKKKRMRNEEETPHLSDEVMPSVRGDGRGFDAGTHRDKAATSTSCIIAKHIDFPEATECRCYSEESGTIICSRTEGKAVVQKMYKDGKLISTKEVYGCKRKEADESGL